MRGIALVTAVLAGLAALAVWLPARREVPREPAQSVIESLSGADDIEGFSRAMGPREFSFPADGGPHPGFQTEWWYYTGNLETHSGRHFGYQLTFFRRALVPPGADGGGNPWRTNEVYFAHFALTDTHAGRFCFAEEWERGAAGLAGARAEPFTVWVGPWSAREEGKWVRLMARRGDCSIDLKLRPLRPPVLNGERGLSRKSAEPGNASYYYSVTRLETVGTLRVGGEEHGVEGSSWLDREWGTSALSPGQEGWDWISLTLSDGRDLMLYQIRSEGGGTDPYSSGTITGADGRSHGLRRDDFTIEPLGAWESPTTATVYPSGWRVTVPEHGLELEVRPRLRDQELRLGFVYWEGAVEASGSGVEGRGYVELTGYPGYSGSRSPD